MDIRAGVSMLVGCVCCALSLQIFCGVRIVSDVLDVVVGCFSGCAIVVLPVILCVGFIFLLNLVSPTQSSPGSRL